VLGGDFVTFHLHSLRSFGSINKIIHMKQCYFSQNNIKHIDYKDIEVLKKFLNPHGRMLSRKKTGISAKYQRKLAEAVKRARFMAILPFVTR
jgi:small subunit ribosomal protein S18